MNRVKIMLMLIGISMVGGGVLAFKARTVGNDKYCVTTNPLLNRCPVGIFNAFIPPGNSIKYVITSDPNKCTVNCTQGEPCNLLGNIPGS